MTMTELDSRLDGRFFLYAMHQSEAREGCKIQGCHCMRKFQIFKSRKKKSLTLKAAQFQLRSKIVKEANIPLSLPLKTGQKAPQKSAKSEVKAILQQPERSTSDSLPDNTSGNEYRALKRKYLLLEEESFALGRELREAEDEVKILENEKLALLDQLVVLEGLI